MGPANLLGSGNPLVGVRGRHLDVDDRDVRAGELDPPQELGRVLGFPDHVEAGIGEEPREPLAEEHRIVGDD